MIASDGGLLMSDGCSMMMIDRFACFWCDGETPPQNEMGTKEQAFYNLLLFVKHLGRWSRL